MMMMIHAQAGKNLEKRSYQLSFMNLMHLTIYF